MLIPSLYDTMVITEMTSLTRAVDADLNMQVVSATAHAYSSDERYVHVPKQPCEGCRSYSAPCIQQPGSFSGYEGTYRPWSAMGMYPRSAVGSVTFMLNMRCKREQ